MPNFRAHTTINLIALAGVSYTAVERYDVSPAVVGVAAASFTVATFLLSPDLDLKHSSPSRNWGPLKLLWRPYQMLFKHRGLSHSLIFSSLSRLVYLGVVAFVAMVLWRMGNGASADSVAESAAFIPDVARSVLGAHGDQLATAAAGVALSDACHIVTDRLVSALRALV